MTIEILLVCVFCFGDGFLVDQHYPCPCLKMRDKKPNS